MIKILLGITQLPLVMVLGVTLPIVFEFLKRGPQNYLTQGAQLTQGCHIYLWGYYSHFTCR